MELLSPAGDLERLKLAFHYGADAVYFGGAFGLRAGAGNDINHLRDGIIHAHKLGKKVYVTVNIFPHNADLDNIRNHVIELEKLGADAVIVADLGVLKIVRENTKLPIHISTQANVLNKFTADEYIRLGASRIILARECSIDEIREIANYVHGRAQIEVFAHGAMCVSYSGRCLLSNYTTARESNRGECAHPCRWKYNLVEEKRPNQYFPIDQDQNGTYIMNSRDLCLIEHLDTLRDAGVDCIKIEGRMKSPYYVASTTNAYRRALNNEQFDRIAEAHKSAHRPYTTGFVFGDDTLYNAHNAPISTHIVVARVLSPATISLNNAFNVGEELEILSPFDTHNKTFTVTKITDPYGNELTRANRAEQVLTIECPYPLHENDFLRKRIGGDNDQ